MDSSLVGPIALWLRRKLAGDSRLGHHVSAAGLTALEYGAAALQLPSLADRLSGRAIDWYRAVERDGYCAVPGYLDGETCRRCIAELERIFSEYPDQVHRRSDHRVFGVESASPLLAEFASDPEVQSLADAVFRQPTTNAFTLGARLDYTPGNAGSGEGWHRDSFVAQFKAILYLTDVAVENGPFQLLLGSEKLPRLALDLIQGRIGFQQNRISDQQVERLLAARPDRLRTFVAPAGTLLLVNTSAIHRGRPIEHGTRYALTNYYFPVGELGPKLEEHFAPVLRARS
jgi:hypothetical protein